MDELGAEPPKAGCHAGLTFGQGSSTPTRSGRTRKAWSGSRSVEEQDATSSLAPAVTNAGRRSPGPAPVVGGAILFTSPGSRGRWPLGRGISPPASQVPAWGARGGRSWGRGGRGGWHCQSGSHRRGGRGGDGRWGWITLRCRVWLGGGGSRWGGGRGRGRGGGGGRRSRGGSRRRCRQRGGAR